MFANYVNSAPSELKRGRLILLDGDEVERVQDLVARCPYSGCGRILAAGEQAQVRRALMPDGDVGSWSTCLECVPAEAADEVSRDGLADALAQIQEAEAELDGLPLVFREEVVGDLIARLSAGWRDAAMALTREGRG
ncbi:MAG: hypothetical protein DI601_06340 [Azospirillum brasilense]|nr:MAG: hypothetical protein DI601_06340 [Azospirillum brasilense]